MPYPFHPASHDWFEPRKLYADGFPKNLTSALQVFTALRRRMKEAVASLDAGFTLEVGPGDQPILEPGPDVCYLDVAHRFLTDLSGHRVEGDLLHAPFSDGMFDLVVAADVFSHIEPAQRAQAIGELCRLAPQIVLFNPEPDAKSFLSAPVYSRDLMRGLREHGYDTQAWPIEVKNDQGARYRFGLVIAVDHAAQ